VIHCLKIKRRRKASSFHDIKWFRGARLILALYRNRNTFPRLLFERSCRRSRLRIVMLPRDKKLKPLSTVMRNNTTKEENRLWYDFLRTYPVRFNRQRIIGKYIVDFYCSKARLVIELDGSQHYEEKGVESDALRTRFMESLGLMVLRFTNLDIKRNFEGVCITIDEVVKKRF